MILRQRRPYGSYGTLWVAAGSLWTPVGSCGALVYGSHNDHALRKLRAMFAIRCGGCVITAAMVSYGTLWVPAGSPWIPMDSCGILCPVLWVPMASCRLLWIPKGSYEFLWDAMYSHFLPRLPMGSCGTLCIPTGGVGVDLTQPGPSA